MQTILTELVGVNFRPASAKEVVDALTIGTELSLEREPENPYDSLAVRVIDPDTEEFIGFIARMDNAEISAHLDAGGTCRTEVVAILARRKPGLKVTLLALNQGEPSEG